MLALSGVIFKGEAEGREDMTGFTDRSWNMTCMSIKACLISLYTDPKKPKGTESWKRRPLTMTRFPTVMVPSMISLAAITMIVERAAEKMNPWPKLRKARDQLVFREASSYFTKDLSYC